MPSNDVKVSSLQFLACSVLNVSVLVVALILVQTVRLFKQSKETFGFRNRKATMTIVSSVGAIIYMTSLAWQCWLDLYMVWYDDSVGSQINIIAQSMYFYAGFLIFTVALCLRCYMVFYRIHLAMSEDDMAWISLVTRPVKMKHGVVDRVLDFWEISTRRSRTSKGSYRSRRPAHTVTHSANSGFTYSNQSSKSIGNAINTIHDALALNCILLNQTARTTPLIQIDSGSEHKEDANGAGDAVAEAVADMDAASAADASTADGEDDTRVSIMSRTTSKMQWYYDHHDTFGNVRWLSIRLFIAALIIWLFLVTCKVVF